MNQRNFLNISKLAAPLTFAIAIFGLTICGANANTIHVSQGQSIQNAVNMAQPGDIVEIQAGANFAGFNLPLKQGNAPIIIRSDHWQLINPNKRVSLSDAPNMPNIIATSGNAAVATLTSAHDYQLFGLNCSPAPGTYTYGLVCLGTGTETTLQQLPQRINVLNCILQGDPTQGGKEGLRLGSITSTIAHNYITGFWSTWQDAQAIEGWNGPGPYTIQDNFLEASGENVMFGGAPTSIPGLIPSNINVYGNYMYKPLSWVTQNPSPVIKDLFELKNASHVNVVGNRMENCWPEAQGGEATIMNGIDGPTSTIEYVTFSNNVFVGVAEGFIVSANDVQNQLRPTNHITFTNNLWEIGYFNSPDGWWGRLDNGPQYVTVLNNTAVTTGTGESSCFYIGDNPSYPSYHFVFDKNVIQYIEYPFSERGGQCEQNGLLNTYAPGAQLTGNLFIGQSAILSARQQLPRQLAAGRVCQLSRR